MPQKDVKSSEVVQTTMANYSKCWMVIFVAGSYLARAWCCLEIAVAMMTKCKITVIGQCDMVEGRDFFDTMKATVASDIPLIKVEIKKLVKSDDNALTAKLVNNIVAHAMEVLFVQAHKDSDCNLSTDARADRGDWGERMKFSSPPNLPRDREKDWAILAGQAREVEEAGSRTLRIFLLSTLMDTVVEWSYFLQDCAKFLMECARLRGFDLILSDMRYGSWEEEALSLDVLATEMECCKDTSADISCLAILGSKYGFRPAPARIPKAEFEELVKLVSDENAVLCKEAYELDYNKLPAPEYVLKDAGHSKLTTALRGAAKLLWPEAVLKELRDPMRSVPLHNLYFSFFSVTEDTWQFPPHPALLRVGPRAARVRQHPGRRTGSRVSAGLSQR